MLQRLHDEIWAAKLTNRMGEAAAWPAERRLAVLSELCAALEVLPAPSRLLGACLAALCRNEAEMLRAGRHERAMLGLRNRIQLQLQDLLSALDGDAAAAAALRRSSKQHARVGAGHVANLFRMVDAEGRSCLTDAPPSRSGRRCFDVERGLQALA